MAITLKICGITNWADAKRAVDVGADLLGFNFYGPSPRFVTVSDAKRIVKRLPHDVKAIGIFVNDDLDDIEDIASMVGLEGVQLHGEEPRQQVAQLARRWPVIKAFRVKPGFRVGSLRGYEKAYAFLLDGFNRKARGGTGESFDWSVARRASRYGRVFVAGGITPENVAQAIAEADPDGIDVCSGVESAPGKKDAAKLRALGAALRAAGWR